MRILHIEKFLDGDGAAAGGVGQYVRALGEAMEARGHQTFAFGCVTDAAMPAMPQLRDFNSAASPLAFVHMLHNDEAAGKLDACLRRQPVDVAHLHNIYHHLTPSILPVLARHGVGIVMTCHDLRQAGRERAFWRWPVERLNLDGIDDHYAAAARRHCTGPGGAALAGRGAIERLLRRYHRWVGVWVCPTQMAWDALCETGVPRSRLRLVRNPVRRPATSNTPRRSNVLLYAGRLAVEKSPELLLPLAARLAGATVRVAGDGPMREPLGVAATRRRVWNLELLGHVGCDRMADLYGEAAAVVVTSRCTENSPAAMLDAMAAGRCVIAPDQRGLREWIDDGETGRLYPTGNVDALVAVAKDLLADRRQRQRLGAAAAPRIERMHPPDGIEQAVIEAYEAAMQIARRRCESQ
ncbi:MAG: glycosyltransferase [Planctomycetes bacterium]|nr:glycosyltransferase family 4 protein [Phycisphaerae bacterium]NBB95372.1 glycosyltransferase [Planctomycetota bacterium]